MRTVCVMMLGWWVAGVGGVAAFGAVDVPVELWLSRQGRGDGQAPLGVDVEPGDPLLRPGGGQVLYLWGRVPETPVGEGRLYGNSLAVDLVVEGGAEITGVVVFNPVYDGAWLRWNLPVNAGDSDGAGGWERLRAVAVTELGLHNEAGRGESVGHDPQTGAVLLAKVSLDVVGSGRVWLVVGSGLIDVADDFLGLVERRAEVWFGAGESAGVAGWTVGGTGVVADGRWLVLGDMDGDGDVDLGDYGLLAGWLSGPGSGAADEAADLDGDGDSDVRDFALFATVFGGGP